MKRWIVVATSLAVCAAAPGARGQTSSGGFRVSADGGYLGLAARSSVAKGKKEKAAAAAKESKWSGMIVRNSKENSTLTVRKGSIEKVIHYDASTKWTKGTAAAEMSEFTDGSRVICLGNYNDKKEFVATRIDLRAAR